MGSKRTKSAALTVPVSRKCEVTRQIPVKIASHLVKFITFIIKTLSLNLQHIFNTHIHFNIAAHL